MCLNHHKPPSLNINEKVSELLDALHRLGEWDKEVMPVIYRDKCLAALIFWSRATCGTKG